MSGNGLFLGVRNVSYVLRGVKRISTPDILFFYVYRRTTATYCGPVEGKQVTGQENRLGSVYLYTEKRYGNCEPERPAIAHPVQAAAGQWPVLGPAGEVPGASRFPVGEPSISLKVETEGLPVQCSGERRHRQASSLCKDHDNLAADFGIERAFADRGQRERRHRAARLHGQDHLAGGKPSVKFLFVHRESELLIVQDFLVPTPDTIAVGGPRKKVSSPPSTPVSNSVSG